jgi:hypothetical protein
MENVEVVEVVEGNPELFAQRRRDAERRKTWSVIRECQSNGGFWGGR